MAVKPGLLNHDLECVIPISLCFAVYNEEDRISYLLESLVMWADEIVIINKSSTDRTKEICLRYGEKVKVVDVPFSPAGHNDSIAMAKIPVNDWIFGVTASEIPTPKLIRRIKQVLSDSKGELDLIYVPRKYYSFGIHDKRSPWSVSYFPFMVNRKKAIISNTVHKNYRPRNPQNTAKIEFSDDCCVYHLTHPTAKNYLHSMTDYFELEAKGCENPEAKIQECMVQIARYKKQLQEGGDALIGHCFAWQIYWLGTALFVWEKWRGIDVAKLYQKMRADIIRQEWLVGEDLVVEPKVEETLGVPIVSAIVSTCNAERFIRGCLEDLEAQTISDRLEIIVINSGSDENEEVIVKEFQKKYCNIKYIKTECRETVYAAWNRGIKVATGDYITNANTDDRHMPYAFERMVHILENKPDFSLVYADVWITEKENQTYLNFEPVGSYKWKEFDPETLIDGCYIGPQPMWRRNLHEKYGYFDEGFHSAGDWEFWLRLAQYEKFIHVREFLGVYLKSATSIEHRDPLRSKKEAEKVFIKYSKKDIDYGFENKKTVEAMYQQIQLMIDNGLQGAALIALEKLLVSSVDYAPAHNDIAGLYLKKGDIDKAAKHFLKATELQPDNKQYFLDLANVHQIHIGKG